MTRNSNKNLELSDGVDESDYYHKALMSSLGELKLTQNKSVENDNENNDSDGKKPTESRIEFVKNILDGNKLKPMIDFDNCDTESAINAKLNKRVMDVKKLFISMNMSLKYIKSGTTGHTFKAVSKPDKSIAFAVKVCAYPKDDKYGAMTNLSRPENTELRMLKLLSYFVINRCTPHFVLPIGTFNTSIVNFVKVPEKFIKLNEKKNEAYRTFIERYAEGDFEEFVSVLISEWCDGGDLLDYIRNNYTKMKLKHWTVIIFQILITLALVHQKYPAFRHNDMKANNILVQLTPAKKNQQSSCYGYSIKKTKFIIPNINLQIKIWDFDFACIDGIIENNKVNSNWTKRMNITKRQNRYYDMHYFFNTLISERFFPQFYKGGAPREIIDFVHRIIPEKYRNTGKYVNKKGRIQIDDEYTTPYKVIMEDPLFANYRYRMPTKKTTRTQTSKNN